MANEEDLAVGGTGEPRQATVEEVQDSMRAQLEAAIRKAAAWQTITTVFASLLGAVLGYVGMTRSPLIGGASLPHGASPQDVTGATVVGALVFGYGSYFLTRKWWVNRFTKRAIRYIPQGWTDDCSVRLRPGRTLEQLVDFVIQQTSAKVPVASIVQELGTEYVFPEEAPLAWDRVLGGVFRAKTNNPRNRPDLTKDPLAWTSYHRAKGKPDLIEAVFPKSTNVPAADRD
jgi:hypothetical protein